MKNCTTITEAKYTVTVRTHSIWLTSPDKQNELLLYGEEACKVEPGLVLDIAELRAEVERESEGSVVLALLRVAGILDWSSWTVTLVEREPDVCGRCDHEEMPGTMFVGDGELLCESCMADEREATHE